MLRIFRSVLLTTSLIFGVLAGSSLSASAHVLKQNNGTSLVLHILPDDDPVAGAPTEMDLSFGGSKNGFSLTDCKCTIEVRKGGALIKQIAVNPSAKGATQTATADFTFPEAAAYTVIVRGAANSGQFKPFNIDYSVKVSASKSDASQPDNGAKAQVALLSFSSLAVLMIVIINVVRRGGRYS